MNEAQAQEEVLREHRAGQQVIAEMMKRMMVWQHQGNQPQQKQGGTETCVVVTDFDADNGTSLDFLGGTNPHGGPPDIGPMQMAIRPFEPPSHGSGETELRAAVSIEERNLIGNERTASMRRLKEKTSETTCVGEPEVERNIQND